SVGLLRAYPAALGRRQHHKLRIPPGLLLFSIILLLPSGVCRPVFAEEAELRIENRRPALAQPFSADGNAYLALVDFVEKISPARNAKVSEERALQPGVAARAAEAPRDEIHASLFQSDAERPQLISARPEDVHRNLHDDAEFSELRAFVREINGE